MMSKYGTKFAETEALMAELEQDQDTLNRVLGGMLPGELLTLKTHLYNLTSALSGEIISRRKSHFVCPACGPYVKADEDGCCAICGADCAVT